MTTAGGRYRFTLYEAGVPRAHSQDWRALRDLARAERIPHARIVKRLRTYPFTVIGEVWRGPGRL